MLACTTDENFWSFIGILCGIGLPLLGYWARGRS